MIANPRQTALREGGMRGYDDRMINTNEPISTLASALLSLHDCDEMDPAAPDMHDALHALRSLLPAAQFNELAFACDTCPIHIIDIEICADDDDPECAHLRD